MSATPALVPFIAPRTFAASLLAAVLAYSSWQVQQSLRLRGEASPVSPPPVSADTTPAARDSALAAVASLHLFGEYRAPEPVPAPPPVQIRESPPGLRLQGVFTSSEATEAAALIAVEGAGPARRFQPGDAIDPQAELVSVALDHVVLRRAGELQRLSLYRAAVTQARLQAISATKPRAARQPRSVRGAQRASVPTEPARAAVVMARLSRLRAGGP
jgi:type II secretory pathway component PulC